MKIQVENYTWVAATGVVTFTDYAAISLENVLLIVDTTRQVVIFQLNNTAKGGTVSTNTLDLEFDTSAFADADKLAIFYEDHTLDFWKKEDAAHVSGHSGVPAWAVRSDAATATGAAGDYVPLLTDASGRLWVNVSQLAPGSGATDLGKLEDAVHASGDLGVMSLAVRKDTATALAGADGDYAPVEVDASGRMWVNVGDVTPGTGATNLGKAEDAAHASGDVGVMSLAVRRDAPASSAGTDGDYSPLAVDSIGRLRVQTGNVVVVDVASSGLTTATTAYTSGDMLGTQWTFSDVAAIAGGAFEILTATLLSDVAAIPGPTDLFLFNASVTQAADNAANSYSDADMAALIGILSFPSPTVSALNSYATLPNLSLFGRCNADAHLYGGLVTRIGHTFFAAADDLHIRLVVRRA